MKPTLLVGINASKHEINTVELLAKNAPKAVDTRYGSVRVVVGKDNNDNVDYLLTNSFNPKLARSRQQVFAYIDKLGQRAILDRVDAHTPNYFKIPYWDSIEQVPSDGQYMAKPKAGARSLCQLSFDTHDKTGTTVNEIVSTLKKSVEQWSREQPEQKLTSEQAFGSNVNIITSTDLLYSAYLNKYGIHYYPGYQFEETESICRLVSSNLYVEELVKDVLEEYRIICVGGQFMLAYPRTLVKTPGSVTRPLGKQELNRNRVSLEQLEGIMPGLTSWLNRLYNEHQYPTWSIDVFLRDNRQWGAFEFSSEYSLADLTSDEQALLWSTLVKRWLKTDSGLHPESEIN